MSYVKRNWKEYNKKLVNRGNIFLWIDEDTFNQWTGEEEKTGSARFFFFCYPSWLVFKDFLPLYSKSFTRFFRFAY